MDSRAHRNISWLTRKMFSCSEKKTEAQFLEKHISEKESGTGCANRIWVSILLKRKQKWSKKWWVIKGKKKSCQIDCWRNCKKELLYFTMEDTDCELENEHCHPLPVSILTGFLIIQPLMQLFIKKNQAIATTTRTEHHQPTTHKTKKSNQQHTLKLIYLLKTDKEWPLGSRRDTNNCLSSLLGKDPIQPSHPWWLRYRFQKPPSSENTAVLHMGVYIPNGSRFPDV